LGGGKVKQNRTRGVDSLARMFASWVLPSATSLTERSVCSYNEMKVKQVVVEVEVILRIQKQDQKKNSNVSKVCIQMNVPL
jgi:hypothetical protein